MYVIAQTDPLEIMPDFLVGEDKNVINKKEPNKVGNFKFIIIFA